MIFRVARERELWRLQGPVRVVVASIRPAGRGFELRLAYEPRYVGQVLLRERSEGLFSSRRLEQRAREVQRALEKQGWKPLIEHDGTNQSRRNTWIKIGAVAAAIGTVSFHWMRRKSPPA